MQRFKKEAERFRNLAKNLDCVEQRGSKMELNEFVRSGMERIRREGRVEAGIQHEIRADENLVRWAGLAMSEKLEEARRKGRGGWWDKESCSTEFLREQLRIHVEKGDMVDVLNFAAMIFARECADGRASDA